MGGDVAGSGLPAHLEALAAGQFQEIAGIGLQVEADEICTQDAAHRFLAPGQLPEEIGGGERDVQEEPDGEIGAHLPEDARQ